MAAAACERQFDERRGSKGLRAAPRDRRHAASFVAVSLARLVPEPGDARTRVAMVRLFFEFSQISLLAALLMIGVRTTWVVLAEPTPWLMPWLLYGAAVLALRSHWRRQCLALDDATLGAQARQWRTRAELVSLGVAGLWVSALWVDFEPRNLSTQMFCAMVACLTCVGSLNVMAPLPRAYWALAAPTLAALALQFAALQTQAGAAAAALVLMGFLLSVSMVHRHARLLYHSHALRFEREDLLAQVERAAQGRSRFLAAASHDLRQPLQALGLLTHRLQAEVSGQAAGRTAQQIERMVEELGALVDGLLDVSRLDAGALEPHRVPMPLAPLLERLNASFALMAHPRQLQWRQRPCNWWVRSDPVQLERVLRNIVDNALRYTERGGVMLAYRRRGDQVLVCVWDTGPGIPESEQARVFEEFVQLNNPGRDRRQGLGLGLAIVARLCRLLGHPLTLRSRVGRGSCFSVALPRVEPDAAALAAQAQAASAAALQAPVVSTPLRDFGVALVEDDEAVCSNTAELLGQWGCRVLAAPDVDRLLAQMAAQPAWRLEAIVSDHRLAHGNGLGAIEHLRRRCGRQVPALLLTGESLPQPVSELAAAGITGARKPLPAFSLRAWLSAQAAAGRPAPVE